MKKIYKSQIKSYRLISEPTDLQKVKIQSASDAAEYIRQFYHDDIEIYESVFILMLNNANNTVGYAKISQGGVVGTVADIRIIAKYAVDSLSSNVIMAHNHPSGTMKPSNADNQLTVKVKNALKLFDINLIDHIILSPEPNIHYSYADEGLI